jgi:amino acid transporter
MIGNVPGGLLLGNGAGLPVSFLLAGVVMALLSVVYVALNRAFPAAGGFAGFVTAGLGRGAGVGTAYATMLCYASATIAYAVGVGYFGSLIAASHGVDTPWWLLTAVAVLVSATLGRRAADLSGKTLVVVLLAEFLLLVILDALILVQKGGGAFPLESFTPGAILSGNIGPALMVGFTSLIGIESGILYTHEVRNPGRSIPRATYWAIALVTLFYVLTCWMIIGGLGASDTVAAAEQYQGDVVFVLAAQTGGQALLVPMQIFFYLFTLAKDGYLPRPLGVLHHAQRVPRRASDLLVAVATLLLTVLAVSGVDPYIGISTSLVGFLTVGLFGVQIVVAVAAIVHFRRSTDPQRSRIIAAAAAGGLCVTLVVGIMAANYSVLTGSDSAWANLPPVLLLVALLAGPIVVRRRARASAHAVAGPIERDGLPGDAPAA